MQQYGCILQLKNLSKNKQNLNLKDVRDHITARNPF